MLGTHDQKVRLTWPAADDDAEDDETALAEPAGVEDEDEDPVEELELQPASNAMADSPRARPCSRRKRIT
jgi:hypothetical protein